jgi:hypothetical protein
MLRRVALVRTDVSKELSAFIIRVARVVELGTLAVTSSRCNVRKNTKSYKAFLRSVRRLLVTANVPSSPILVTLMMEAITSSETSVLTRARLRNIPFFIVTAVKTSNLNNINKFNKIFVA